MTKKTKLIVTFIILLVATLIFLRFIIGGPEDGWVCDGGQWIKHGVPDSPMPTELCK